MSFVGIDIGGTFVKACSWTAQTGFAEVTRNPVPQFTTNYPAREFDPVALVAVCDQVLREAIDQSASRVEHILLTGQVGGLVLVDVENPSGTRAFSWQDERFWPRQELIELSQAFGLPVIGDPPRVGHPMVVLDHLRPPKQIKVESILSFVSRSLCKGLRSVVHLTDAAALGLCEIRSGTWSKHGLSFLGLSELQLPLIVNDLIPVGQFNGDIPLSCGIGDQQSSLIGVGLERNEVSVNLATGCQVSRIENIPRSDIQTRPYFFGTYLQTITHLPAGRLLSSAVEQSGLNVQNENSWLIAEEMSRSAGTNQVKSACEQIVASISKAIESIRSDSTSTIAFSGGVAQKFSVIRRLVEAEVRLDSRVFEGDDAALAGLQRLSRLDRDLMRNASQFQYAPIDDGYEK